jgi:chromosome partitioning protein
MDGNLLTHEFAAALGITKKTLMQYEKEGKLPPAKRRQRGKLLYRCYTPADLIEARQILNMPSPLSSQRRQLFMNLKGGVGKSVLSYNYGYCVAKRGIKTLLIDLDAQAHLTTYAGLQPENFKVTLFNVLLENVPVEAAIQRTALPTLDIIPSNLTLSPLELSLFGRHAREYRLQRILEPLKDQYQVMVIDAPPNLSLLNVNAILSVQDLIVPVMPDFFSYDGLRLLFDSLAQFRKDLTYELENVYVLLNGFNALETVCQQSRKALETHYGDYLLNTIVRKSTTFPKSTAVQQSVFEYEPGSKAAQDIETLVQEILTLTQNNQKAVAEAATALRAKR